MIFKFFNFLKKNSIEYCIINGYKDIVIGCTSDSDIDILFKKVDFFKIEDIIKGFCRCENYKMVQLYHQEVLAKNIFIYDPESHNLLNLDIYGELSRKKILFFNEREIFNTLKYYKEIPILSHEKEFVYYLVKKLDKDDLTKDNFRYLRALFINNKFLCNKTISNFFPTFSAIVSKAFNENSFLILNENRDVFIKEMSSLQKTPFKRSFINKRRIFKRITKPTGITIAFLGPDGSGKSTIINELYNNILPFRRKEYFHLKPIKNKVAVNENTIVTDPHKDQPYSKPKSYIKLLYFIYQYNIGWIKSIIPLKIRSSLIIFDRFFDDLLVDHKRYRFGGSKKIAKLTRMFIPRPELYFILTTEPKVIYNRKQEVSFEELERQIKAYNNLVDNKRYFHIDVNDTPEEIAKKIIKIMMNKMNERY